MSRSTITVLVTAIVTLIVLSLVAWAETSPAPASAGDTRWGDLDCSGTVSPVDSLKTLRKDAGLSVSQEPGCWLPGEELMIGGSSRLWGDVDCADGINPVDSLKLLRFDAGLPSLSAVVVLATCPDIGSLFNIGTPTPTPSPTPVPGSISELKVGSALIEPGDTVTISVTADATNLGSYRIDVQYDASLVGAIACTSTHADPGCSIDLVAPDTVRLLGTNIDGITGDDIVLGTITFITDPSGLGGTAALTVDPATQVLTDKLGQPLNVTATNGAITIALAPTPTPSPTAAPTASPSPTVTPGALPSTEP